MAIDKSRGQSFDGVCVYLPVPKFGDGQLHAAPRRARDQENPPFEQQALNIREKFRLTYSLSDLCINV
ncbi:hypothetical protein J437_LFUL001629 [Ladona fulva]|uniref:Uncharacterized protein n=1 Tax=Ladona fulva TaxID=123851 RepID=A0A8K0JYP9_LADFU|nr:hypothetical protein J437_LFUL001629 [Ladona fulva]